MPAFPGLKHSQTCTATCTCNSDLEIILCVLSIDIFRSIIYTSRPRGPTRPAHLDYDSPPCSSETSMTPLYLSPSSDSNWYAAWPDNLKTVKFNFTVRQYISHTSMIHVAFVDGYINKEEIRLFLLMPKYIPCSSAISTPYLVSNMCTYYYHYIQYLIALYSPSAQSVLQYRLNQ